MAAKHTEMDDPEPFEEGDFHIMHRDLKPQNVMMTYGDRPFPKLVDFGLAIEYETEEDLTTSPMYGANHYAAPEIFQFKKYNKSLDVFSIGVLFLEMIKKEEAFAQSENMPIGKMMNENGVDMVCPATDRPDDDPIVVAPVKKVVREMIHMELLKRISAKEATRRLKKIFIRWCEKSGALEVPPPKPLHVAVAEIVNRVARGASSSS